MRAECRAPRPEAPEDTKVCLCGERYFRQKYETRKEFAERKVCSPRCTGLYLRRRGVGACA